MGNIVPALEYLISSNRKGLGEAVPAFDSGALDAAGKRVIVIGGGDTAMDCVRTAVRQGAQSVQCLYRRDRANMPGSMREVRHAEEEGVEFVWQAAPEAFLGDANVRAVRAVRMRLGAPDATGRRKPEPVADSSFVIEADLVIKALGFDPEDLPVLFDQPELQVTRWGTVRIDWQTMMTAHGRRVRGRRHRARRLSGGVGRARRARCRRGDSRAHSGQGAGAGLGILRSGPMASQEAAAAERFVADYQRNAAHLARHGLYDPADEHAACGVGFVAAIDGQPRRQVVEAAIDALRAVWHRGAVDADGKTGDGAGIYLEIPQNFFREQLHSDKDVSGRLAVGMVFLPRTDFAGQERCRTIVETEILGFGYAILGWRQVPVDTSVIGEKAIATRPEIEQIIVGNAKDVSDDEFERELFLIRRRIEKQVLAEHINGFYICSLSCRSIIYKGLFLAEQLSVFYPDLQDARFISSFAVFHQRYSTNTWPSWQLAQPFRTLAHNGEINTLRGNLNWMKSHETRMVAPAFGEYNEHVKPIVQTGSSDSAALDAVVEALVRAGRSLPLVKTLLIPPAWARKMAIPQAHKDLFSYCNCVMEPWDGPAAVVACDGHWVVGGMDRNGLRPMRYTRTDDDLLVVGSETGMVPLPPGSIVEQGRVGPGEMIGVDLREGVFYRDQELKDLLAGEKPYGQWVQNITHLDNLVAGQPVAPVQMERAELRRRQNLFGISHEELELLLAPMVLDAKEAVGSMGDDTPMAVLSSRYRGLHHFFRQQFSQVTNPPIDPLREYRVMSLKTRYGNLGNVYDEAPSQTEILLLESPLLLSTEFQAFLDYFGPKATTIDCTFEVDTDPGALREALARIRIQAEDAVREGYEQIVLSDQAVSETRAPIPMILAVGAVHSHLVRQGLRSFSSITVRSGECLDVHYVAVLIGAGATAVNPYLAEAAIAERHARGLFPGFTLDECLRRYKEAVDQGLLKIISKMGISIISSYRGGYNFEAIGLSRSLCAEYFPGLNTRLSGIGHTGIQKKVLALHRRAYADDNPPLQIGGLYRYRRGGERHALDGPAIHQLQYAVATDSYAAFKKYTEMVYQAEPLAIRDLLGFDRQRHDAGADRRGRNRSPRSASASSRRACRSARSARRRTKP